MHNKTLLSFEEVVDQYKDDTEFWALGDNGKKYDAHYNSKLEMMFFAIISTVEIIGYIPK